MLASSKGARLPKNTEDATEGHRFAPQLGRSALLLAAVLAFFTLLLGTVRAANHPFWSDELATIHIAQAPSWSGMLARGHQADLNPPLEPALVRLSQGLFGPHEFAGRVPSLLFYSLFVGCFFLFLHRRMGREWAVFGALLLVANADAVSYLTEARPYALLLGALALATLAYDTLLHDPDFAPVLTRVVLCVALCLLLLSHIFGSYAAGAFLLAEAVRSVRRRRIDPLTALALVLPLVCCLTYLPLFHQQGAGHTLVYDQADRPSLTKAIKLPYVLLFTPLSVVFKIAFLLIFFLPFFPTTSFFRTVSPRAELWALLLCLLSTPLIVFALFHLRAPTSGFYPRYSLAVVVPGYYLLVMLLCWRSGANLAVARTLVVLTLIAVAATFSDLPGDLRQIAWHGLLAEPEIVTSDGGVSGVHPELPLVMADALQFMVADYELDPHLGRRPTYLTSPSESLRLAHQNAGESIADMARAFALPSPVLPYAPFIATHRQFLLLTLPNHPAWLSAALREKHAEMESLGSPMFAGKHEDLWLVTLPIASSTPQP